MHTIKKIIFCFFLVSTLYAHEKAVYIYSKDVEGKVSETTWTVEEKENNLHIHGKNRTSETLLVTSPPLNTQCFSHQSKKTNSEYYIHRDGPFLYAKRSDQAGVSQKEFRIGKDLWIQEFDFSLRPFILSSADSVKFYIVHPTKLSLHSMAATKLPGLESLHVNGHTYEAIKVRINLNGLKKMFWKAELWFDQSTGDLLKYMANEGPNTPVSVVTLLSKTQDK